MNGNIQPPGPRAWFGPIVVGLLAAQLGLTWVQGRLLHRQHQDIQGLREDIQSLTESLDQGTSETLEEEGGLAPARVRRVERRAHRFVRVARGFQEEQPDPAEQAAKKDLEEARKSAQKAVKDAREVQQKLSIAENARKAEEKARQAPKGRWSFLIAYWLPVSLLAVIAGGVLAIAFRIWSRRTI